MYSTNKKSGLPSYLGVMMLLCLLLSFASCTSNKEENNKKKGSAIALEESENDYIVCNTLFESPKLSSKKFHSPLIPMVWVEGGSFAYDRNGLEGGESKAPKHIFTLDSFYISKYEITQAQWQSVMKFNPSDVPGTNLPVDNVSWEEAVEFCNRLSKREGLQPAYRITPERISCNFQAEGYRLPTEAEWEYAAEGGNKSKGYSYSGSNDIDEVAWYLDNSDRQSHPVGLKQANELGLHDMSGNVWEWCWDWYNDKHYSHVIRGGSWYSLSNFYGDDCLIHYETRYYYFEPETWVACIPVGIRICRSR